jgi:tetratricopeptide (TPR) repeat protein
MVVSTLASALASSVQMRAQVPGPSSPLSEDWKRVRSTNFVAIGNASDKELRNALVELERFREALIALFPYNSFTAPVPTILVLFKENRALAPYKPRDEKGKIRDNVAGYFSMYPDVNHMVSAAYDDPADSYYVLFHEYSHYVIHRSAAQIPTWADEGLAEFYATFRTRGNGEGILGSPPKWRVNTLRSGEPLLSFEEMFTNEGVARVFRNDALRQRFYAQTWALVHYLMVGKRAGQLKTYLTAVNQGLSPEDAFRTAFGVSFDALRGELRAHLRQVLLPGFVVTFPQALTVEQAPIERMLETDALHARADLLVRQEAFDEAEPLLMRALRLDPAHVPSRVALAAVYRDRERYDDVMATLRAVIADAPRDFAARYALARVLTTTLRHEEALDQSNQLAVINERSPDAWLQLSVAALAMDRTSQAAVALTRARQLYPTPSWLRTRAFRLFEIGRDADLASDVEAYIKEVGWGNEGVPYAAFLGALADWRTKEAEKAETLLAGVAKVTDADSWAAVVTAFMRGSLAPQAFINRARGIGQETEAHAYVGLKAAVFGQRADALKHLQWVKDQGSRAYGEYGLALAELRRLRAAS